MRTATTTQCNRYRLSPGVEQKAWRSSVCKHAAHSVGPAQERLRRTNQAALSSPLRSTRQAPVLPTGPSLRVRPLPRLAPTKAAATDAAEVVSATHETAFEELCAGTARKYIMISGKGGVGKTSLSASLAVRLAAAGHTTLIVSTDPAHSLSDSLAQDVSGGKPVLLEGTDLPLWGMEVDPEEGRAEFAAQSKAAGVGSQATDFLKGMGLGMVANQLADLKLGELLDTPPPGLDEAVAISKVVQFVDSQEYARFSRIVFDTAPTGHTLRLLTLPDFVDASIGKVVRLRKKLGGAATAVRGLFGATEEQDEIVSKLEKLQERVRMVKKLFRDKEQTEFIIATIPTVLGINESARLLEALKSEGIPCKRIIVNQVIESKAGDTFLKLRLKDQAAALKLLDDDPNLKDLTHIRAPLVDLEVRGVPALQYFGGVVWQEQYFNTLNEGSQRRYYLLGGKGGVGKTSCSSAFALKCAAAGKPTLVVSTDPAHSLSDSFDQDLTSGLPVQITSPLPGADELPLWGMQIDVSQAREELRAVVSGGGGKGFNDFLDNLGLGMITQQLKELDLGELMDTPPPGIDEAIAISKVVQFLDSPQYSHFERIIFDTAPTGHTLRLLTLPDFLDASLGKVIRLRGKLLAAADAVKSFITGKGAEADPAVVKMEELRTRMARAQALFHDANSTQFIIVTIPTVMAASESARLAVSLREEGIPCNTLVVNQVIAPEATQKFLETRSHDQQRALAALKADPGLGSLQLIEGPLLDLEVRGAAALQYFGGIVWK